jgi:hypothetical protein
MHLLTFGKLSLLCWRRLASTKVVLAMKLSIILVLVSCLQANGKETIPLVTLHLKEASVNELVDELRKQTDYIFILDEDVRSKDFRFTISIDNAELKSALNQSFKDFPIAYEIKGHSVEISTDHRRASLFDIGITIPLGIVLLILLIVIGMSSFSRKRPFLEAKSEVNNDSHNTSQVTIYNIKNITIITPEYNAEKNLERNQHKKKDDPELLE